MAKYGMSMCVLGMAEEFKSQGIAVNALWPRTAIQTAAMDMLAGPESASFSRKPDIMADAAYHILCKDPKTTSGNFFIDEDIIKEQGLDLVQYACDPANANNLMPDFFLDTNPEDLAKWQSKLEAAPAAKANASEVEVLFKKIETLLSEDLVKRTNAVFLFNVKGPVEESWFLDLKNGSGKCGRGDGSVQADATLTMKSTHFFDLFAGNWDIYFVFFIYLIYLELQTWFIDCVFGFCRKVECSISIYDGQIENQR